MNKKIISYYNKELRFLREMGQEFASQYPKIASRLKLSANETPDPYVERLLEGVAYLTARTQLKIDAEYPRFVQRILEVIYPQFLHPTPASTIIKFDTSKHYNVNVLNTLKRGHLLESLPIDIDANTLSCHFSLTQDTELTPIELEASHYTNSLSYLPDLKTVKTGASLSALRLDFSLSSAIKCSDLTPEDFVFYLGSDLPVASQLLNLLMNSCTNIVCHSFEDARKWYYPLEQHPEHKGFADEEALVFDLDKSISSLRLMQEYIQLPEKFLFVSQHGIKKAIRKAELNGDFALTAAQTEEVIVENGVNKRVVGHEKRRFSVSFLFDSYVPELTQLLKEQDITINTAPLVNLFRKKSVRFPVTMQNTEHHVIVDRVHPLNFEVHSIERVKGFDKFNNQQINFTPIYKAADQEVFINKSNNNAFFSMRRDKRVPSTSAGMYGGRTSYLGSEVYLSMMSEGQSVFSFKIDHLAVEAWCTNRDLPLIMARSVESDFLIDVALPIRGAHIISEVTKPIDAVNEEHTLWSLLNQLNLSYVSLADYSEKDSTLLLKELLLAFPHENNELYKSEVNSIKRLTVEPITKLVRHKGAGSLVKGMAITITFDESLLAGVHPFLFASILRRYFARSISINSFVEMNVLTVQKGQIIKWKDIKGEKSLL
ncbi:type VI secretion system baseplate subunit TssF [Psychrobacter sp. FME13]|uniref:type VI secretion system baseplate subunit TssF n=1 Tax=Psychrobacter sp. FME13 TaxID=2487708 RepID=UPI0017880A3E|nr:type VI secretion system baseplate subunit TssF [Psychrobacter sp. FME13]MBE0441221.1 type VI secretion system baseplate subunit TssF [Psychrobacter sp. FME13]